MPNPRRSSACDCTCVLTRIDHCHAHSVLFLPTGFGQVHSQISDALSQALCNLSLAFLADFIAFSRKLHSAFPQCSYGLGQAI